MGIKWKRTEWNEWHGDWQLAMAWKEWNTKRIHFNFIWLRPETWDWGEMHIYINFLLIPIKLWQFPIKIKIYLLQQSIWHGIHIDSDCVVLHSSECEAPFIHCVHCPAIDLQLTATPLTTEWPWITLASPQALKTPRTNSWSRHDETHSHVRSTATRSSNSAIISARALSVCKRERDKWIKIINNS